MWGLIIGLLFAVGTLEWGYLTGWILVSAAAQVMTYWYAAWASLIAVIITVYFVTMTMATVSRIDLIRHPLGHFVFSVSRLDQWAEMSIPGIVRMGIRFGLALLASRYLLRLPANPGRSELVGVGLAVLALLLAATLGILWRHQRRGMTVRSVPNSPPQ